MLFKINNNTEHKAITKLPHVCQYNLKQHSDKNSTLPDGRVTVQINVIVPSWKQDKNYEQTNICTQHKD